jgi:DNA-nicking Smr family endonuclease
MSDEDVPVEIPLSDVLDLHAFAPRDVAALVEHYVEECRGRGWRTVRIVHGKGIGVQRQTVQRVLDRSPHVLRYETAGEGAGGWGATVVELRPG